mmetsp:Transcript_7385/g.25417  ORF Transcript_7385/g.25417 Transcript_7385/m.25417 type:complete len:261 (+) Transcript_7385:93-875(+)
MCVPVSRAPGRWGVRFQCLQRLPEGALWSYPGAGSAHRHIRKPGRVAPASRGVLFRQVRAASGNRLRRPPRLHGLHDPVGGHDRHSRPVLARALPRRLHGPAWLQLLGRDGRADGEQELCWGQGSSCRASQGVLRHILERPHGGLPELLQAQHLFLHTQPRVSAARWGAGHHARGSRHGKESQRTDALGAGEGQGGHAWVRPPRGPRGLCQHRVPVSAGEGEQGRGGGTPGATRRFFGPLISPCHAEVDSGHVYGSGGKG